MKIKNFFIFWDNVYTLINSYILEISIGICYIVYRQNEIMSKWHKIKKRSRECHSLDLLLCLFVVTIPVKPFADIVASYSCSDRNKKWDNEFQVNTPFLLPDWVWQHSKLYHTYLTKSILINIVILFTICYFNLILFCDFTHFILYFCWYFFIKFLPPSVHEQ